MSEYDTTGSRERRAAERDDWAAERSALIAEYERMTRTAGRYLLAFLSARQRARELRQDFELLRKIVMPDQDEEPPPLPPLVPLADANAAVLFARSDLVDTPPPLPDWFACPRTEDPCRLVFPAPLYPADRALEEQP